MLNRNRERSAWLAHRPEEVIEVVSITATRSAFPQGFVWGVSTASYQIEGAVDVDGRGASIWDTFSHTPGRVYNGDTGDRACDHYHRLDEDLDLVASLGAGTYRFSIAWPRIQPDGRGPANQAGLDFYRRLVDGLRSRGVTASPTLYHWDLPQALQDAGGWVARDTAERFGEYARIVAEALGDGVERWITLNEPWCSAWHGYGNGLHAPGHTDPGAAAAATHHLMLAHARAVSALRDASASAVGITLNLVPVRAASEDPADVAAARRLDGNANRLWLDSIFEGHYPEDMLEHYAGATPGFSVVQDGDLSAICAPLDFLGINYYSPALVADPSSAERARTEGLVASRVESEPATDELGVLRLGHAGTDRTAMGWEIEPEGLTELLRRIDRDYNIPPIYITENGAAYHDYVDPEGRVLDDERIAYIDAHIGAVANAMEAGVDVRGYFCWSLLDNFEWGRGYSKRFGLVYIDYPTGTRIPKKSYSWFKDLVAANSSVPVS
ncbi:MAG TPA: GH1 family beta-glucosidase [Solirubrobacteraceae bacterium]